ncbi:GATA transcription factor 26-like [Hibiscus syriacus]|uniref:GATA transcription factor 26-like n=1 Tax=Hibiscus syriacus TaxID=106335 RepID=UPI001921E7E8|nr:GATA transcription factor 26-like [Hibiscus syriacus]
MLADSQNFRTDFRKMRKIGPCFHCGVDSTPLWRNGPPEKPVLCNACGSRYRLGKPLENYAPKALKISPKKRRKQVTHSRTSSSDLAGYNASSESSASHHPNRVTLKQEILDDCPVEMWGNSWRIHTRKRSKVVYDGLTTTQKLQKELHTILRDEFNGSIEAEDVLINNININKLKIPPIEIGLGTILFNFPVPSPDQQETRVFPPNHPPTTRS